MSLELLVSPKTPPQSWEEFCLRTERYSIALDGYVFGSPRCDVVGLRVNFNHHEEVSRLETRSTCAQVLIAIRMGLFELFRLNNEPHALVYANDCDEDVCMSWYLLLNNWIAEPTMNPRLNRLVSVVDMLDTTAGAYPFIKDMFFLREVAWVFEPYRQFRLSGALDQKDSVAFTSVVTDVSNRIAKHIFGSGGHLSLDMRYTLVGGGVGWSMIEEIGAQGRVGAFADGIKAFVSVRRRENGNYTYSVGRTSVFIPFDIPRILSLLNIAEGLTEGDCWGGGDTIGGSPRVSGSKLTPSEVTEIINKNKIKSVL